MQKEISIRHFTDYRAFLAAHVQDMKRSKTGWSLGSWAQHMGLKDTSSITKILNGDREPGEQIESRMISYFQFQQKDADYFRDLIRLSKIRKDSRLSVLLLEKMAKKHPNESHRLLDEKTFSVISNWFYLPLREMTRLSSFQENSEWMTKQFNFKVGARDLKSAIEAMLQLKLLIRDSKGRLQIAEGRLSTSDDIASEAIKRYHEQMLENAKEAIRSIDVRDRENQAESFVMSSKNIEQAKQMIREFREKFSRTFEDESGDCVYQIQLQLFPLTKKQEVAK